MASRQAMAYRRAKALESLNRTVRRFSKLYDIEIPDVAAPNLRDPEMGRIAIIEGLDTMLKAILKKAEPTPEAEEEVAERDAQAEADKAAAKAAAQAEREEAKALGPRPDLSTEAALVDAPAAAPADPEPESAPAATPRPATEASKPGGKNTGPKLSK